MKKRFGLINMAISKEGEETVFSFEKQIEKLTDENDKLKSKVKNLEEENSLLKQQNEIYIDIIIKNKLSIEDIKPIQRDNILPKPVPAWKMLDSDVGTVSETNSPDTENKIDEKIKLGNELNKNKKENVNCILCNGYVDLHNRNKGINKCDTCLIKSEHNSDKYNNNDTQIPTPSNSSCSNSIDVNYDRILINKERLRIVVNKLILTIRIKKLLNKIEKEKQSNSNGNDGVETNSYPAYTEQEKVSKKIQKHRNKELPILERFTVKVYNDKDLKNSEVLQFVGSEDCFMIEYQYKIADKINKKIDEISIDDVIDFKIKYEGFRNTRTRRTELKHLITRCRDLFEKYGKGLGKFKISLYYLKIMSDDEWIEWLNEFDKLFNKVVNKEDICKHQYKNGKECGKLNCKIKHKDNI